MTALNAGSGVRLSLAAPRGTPQKFTLARLDSALNTNANAITEIFLTRGRGRARGRQGGRA